MSLRRCPWCGTDPLYVAYHDDEWGRPVADERRLFEKLCLEGFQCGLSWLTILRKRPAFRAAFDGFDPQRVARYGAADVRRLLGDAGIVRHGGKIEAAIANAGAVLAVRRSHGSLAGLLWSFAPDRTPAPRRLEDLPAKTAGSEKMSKALRALGFRFVGPTTAYALMQSVGMVNDHLVGCAVRSRVEADRRAFDRPACRS